MAKTKKAFQLTKVTTDKGWFDGEKYIPFDELSVEHLQNAYKHCQKKELYFFNRAGKFAELQEPLREEAVRRGIELEEFSEFHEKSKRFREKDEK